MQLQHLFPTSIASRLEKAQNSYMQIFTHALCGWLISQPLHTRRDRQFITLSAIISDLDGLTLLGGVEFYQTYHHTFGHNALTWTATVAGCALASKERAKAAFISFFGFGSHIILDLFGSGKDWPIQIGWPFWEWEFSFSPPFQWELSSWQNLLACILFLSAMLIVVIRKKRSIVEVFSIAADREVVRAINRRLEIDEQ
jgi:hypothetical protein